MTPLTVVHVAGSAQWAGGEIFLMQMADRLDRSQIKMRVICPEDGPLRDEMRRRYIPCETIHLSPLGNPFPIRKLSEQFQRWNADVVQSHGARANFYARLAAGSVPNISTVHNALSDYPVGAVKKYLYARLDAWSAPKATALACVAESLKRELIGRIPSVADKTRVLYNGVDLERFDPLRVPREKFRAELKIDSHFVIGLVGRMTDQKGHAFLLEALRDIKPQMPPFRVLFVGDGPLRGPLEKKAAEYGLAEECLFLSVRRDIPEILAAMDLLVMPSISEGFPYVLLEALAMRCPVLASDVNGAGEILDDGRCGILVPPRDAKRLGETILGLFRNPGLAEERAAAGRQRVEKLFSLNAAMERWTSLYEELAVNRRAN